MQTQTFKSNLCILSTLIYDFGYVVFSNFDVRHLVYEVCDNFLYALFLEFKMRRFESKVSLNYFRGNFCTLDVRHLKYATLTAYISPVQSATFRSKVSSDYFCTNLCAQSMRHFKYNSMRLYLRNTLCTIQCKYQADTK